MGIEETVDQFIDIWNAVFTDVTLDRVSRSDKLEWLMKDILTRKGLRIDMKMNPGESGGGGCKVYVRYSPSV